MSWWRCTVTEFTYFTYYVYIDPICAYARQEVLKQRASKISRSLCETFAFATTKTVSIASGNRVIQAVGNVSWLLGTFYIAHSRHLVTCFLVYRLILIQEVFSSIHCQQCPGTSRTQCCQGSMAKILLHKGVNMIHILHILHILHIYIMIDLIFSCCFRYGWESAGGFP